MLVLVLLALPVGASADDKEKDKDKDEAPVAHEIVFEGKLTCSVKRVAPIPVPGVISEVLVDVGQKVSAGDKLARYVLSPESVQKLRLSLSPPSISELEVRMAALNGQLSALKAKYDEVSRLVEQRMASPQNKALVAQEIQALDQQRSAIRKQLDLQRQSVLDEFANLQIFFGDDISPNHIPDEVSLRSPMDGHVLWINPDIREGGEVAEGEAMLIGVMDPMIIKAHLFESELIRIQPGDKAEVTLGSLPGKTFEAVFSRLSWSPITPGLDKPSYYEVELTVANPDLLLKDGYKTQVIFRPAQ